MQKTIGDSKRSLDEREVETRQELKKLKPDSTAASSLQFKGNRIQFEFKTQLLDCIDLALSNLSEETEPAGYISKRPSLTSRNALS